jgi:hypothetical protein
MERGKGHGKHEGKRAWWHRGQSGEGQRRKEYEGSGFQAGISSPFPKKMGANKVACNMSTEHIREADQIVWEGNR